MLILQLTISPHSANNKTDCLRDMSNIFVKKCHFICKSFYALFSTVAC